MEWFTRWPQNSILLIAAIAVFDLVLFYKASRKDLRGGWKCPDRPSQIMEGN